jgi:threonine/homoserine/homoserine lactone efflux protein
LQAENQTLAFIQKMVNYFLSVVGLIALIYLLYHGFQMVTAAGDDAKFKSGAKALRSATIAII